MGDDVKNKVETHHQKDNLVRYDINPQYTKMLRIMHERQSSQLNNLERDISIPLNNISEIEAFELANSSLDIYDKELEVPEINANISRKLKEKEKNI